MIVKKQACTVLLFLVSLAAAGCSIIPEQVTEHPDVVVEAVEETNYNLAEVARGDIRLTQKIYFLYSQTEEEQIAFETEGRRVVSVYAEVGDEVKKGDLLASLYSEDLEEDLASYRYQKERYELLNAQAKEVYEYDLDVLKQTYDSGSLTKSEYKQQVSDRKDSYNRTTEENEDALTIVKLRIAEIEEEIEGCSVYAGIDGVVTYMLPRLEGTTSDNDVTVFRVINSDGCLFQMEDSTYSDYFELGQKVYLKVSDEVGYETTVTRTDTVCLEPDEIDTELAVGTRCYYELLLDERTDVLYLPNRCVYQADDQAYVFVEDEGGVMSIRDITIGLQGDSYTEITGGLEEGDIVIKK
jgi:multidrug efflux pump subunit AcrA (membrane-fusion protein)